MIPSNLRRINDSNIATNIDCFEICMKWVQHSKSYIIAYSDTDATLVSSSIVDILLAAIPAIASKSLVSFKSLSYLGSFSEVSLWKEESGKSKFEFISIKRKCEKEHKTASPTNIFSFHFQLFFVSKLNSFFISRGWRGFMFYFFHVMK